MMADHGTNRYVLNKKRRTKTKSFAKPGSGTNNYTPMYVTDQTKLAGQIRTNNTPLYHMMNEGGKASLIFRKNKKGGCMCKGGRMGIVYKK